jgi:hypothetical protein
MQLPGVSRLGNLGMVGERKAVALLCLSFYATLFFLITLSARSELPEWAPCFAGMTLLYLVTFVGVAAEWFWGRWFAIGIGYSGVTMALMTLVSTRSLPPPLMIFGGMHGLVALCLMGEKMAAHFEAKPEWRERWNLDEQGVVRVRKSVTRAASSLPALVLFALAPRGEAAAIAVTGLAVLGLFGLLEGRAWGVLTLGASGLASLGLALVAAAGGASWSGFYAMALQPMGNLVGAPVFLAPAVLVGGAGLLLCAAWAPFAGPIARHLTRSR